MRSGFRILRRVVAAVLASLLGISVNVNAVAQTPAGKVTVSEVRIEGAQRIERETILSYLRIKVGDEITPERLDDSLKALFETGLFADVTVRSEGSVVVVRVVENPIINRIAFEGNRRIDDETLQAEVQLRPRLVYTRSRVQADVQRIIDIYRRNGRFAATVEPKVIQLEQNRVDLVFEINEGKVTEIRRIDFVGNHVFSDGELADVIQTKESAWYNILATTDTYDPDRLTFDRELLRRYYLANGYADFRVVSVVAELTPDRQGFIVTFTVEEGQRYKFGAVDVTSAIPELDVAVLKEQVTVAQGDWYDADKVEKSITQISETVGNLGFAFVEVTPRVRRDREKLTIDVTFAVQEGPRVFVERINITGNLRTEDRVIRREIPLVEGDAFSTARIRRARTQIDNLGFFSRVEVTNVPGSEPDKTVVNVDVREHSTGEISFGAGFSSSAGVLGDVTIRERNLLGKGQDLKLGLRIGQLQQQIDFSFTEPYFLERKLAAGIDAFRTSTNRQTESSFDQDSLGGALRMGYSLSDNIQQSWKYTIREDRITNVASTASAAIKEQQGSASTSSIEHDLTFDGRDSRVRPTSGYLVQLSNTFAGLGGSVHFLRNEVVSQYYIPIAEKWVGNLLLGGGYIFGLGQSTRIIDRFTLGGQTLRGFANAGVGPRDIDPATGANDAIGGNWYYRGSAQVRFPMGLPDEFGVSGRIFLDFGTLADPNSSSPTIVDTGSIRMSVGGGIGWVSPFGPISVDLGFPLLKESFDKKELVRFSFGTRF